MPDSLERPEDPANPPRLTIGIPTYNRAAKLKRLLDELEAQVDAAGDRVGILVSDNCSTDRTSAVTSDWAAAHPDVRLDVVRHPVNVGPGRNFRFVYDEAPGQYVWLFGDDDLPMPNAVERILRAIDSWHPDVIAGGFEQPPGTLLPVLPPGAADQMANDPSTAARAICGMTKLTGFVLRTRVLPRWAPGDALDSKRLGFPHCVFALSILELRGGGRTGLLSRAIAASDEDFNHLRTSVADWSAYEDTLGHPFVARHAPDLAGRAARTGYALLIDFLWGWRTGIYEIDEAYREEYWSELRRLEPRWREALKIPRSLLLHTILKIDPVHLPRIISRIRRRLTARRPATPGTAR